MFACIKGCYLCMLYACRGFLMELKGLCPMSVEKYHFSEYLDDFVNEYREALDDDGVIDYMEMLSLGSKAVGLALSVDEIWDSKTKFDRFLSRVEHDFDFYIRPFDIVGVPEVAESFIEDILLSLILNGLQGIYDVIGVDSVD